MKSPKLHYVDTTGPGWARKAWGRGFVYLDETSRRITDPDALRRLRELAIPRPWRDVWICRSDRGHIQACGFDMRERKQYLYHPDWQAWRQASKFDRLHTFIACLPALRKEINQALRLPDWPREKVVALVTALMERHFLRVGNRGYTRANGSYGATTLRRKHLQRKGTSLSLRYSGKHGQDRHITLDDPRLRKMIQACSELPGYEIFRYREGAGFRAVQSEDVNEWIRGVTGENFTARHFRTYGGTVTALRVLPAALETLERYPRRKLESEIVRRVSAQLGNTQAVCRAYYIHPAVLEFVGRQHDATSATARLRGMVPAHSALHGLPDAEFWLRLSQRAESGEEDLAEVCVANLLDRRQFARLADADSGRQMDAKALTREVNGNQALVRGTDTQRKSG